LSSERESPEIEHQLRLKQSRKECGQVMDVGRSAKLEAEQPNPRNSWPAIRLWTISVTRCSYTPSNHHAWPMTSVNKPGAKRFLLR
jgi:hypothetical protein